jgi:Cysteine-rich CWC
MAACTGTSFPQGQKRKICEACGQEFLCNAMGTGCWCEEIRLTTEAREEISRRYCDCLCLECLSKFQAEDGYTPTENPSSV